MMAYEGVIATLFYRMISDERLAGAGLDIDLKIIAATGPMARQAEPTVSMMESADRYMELFPEDRVAMADIVIATTYGATVSQDAVRMYERAARSGRLGNIDAFRANAQALFKRLRELTAEVTAATQPTPTPMPAPMPTPAEPAMRESVAPAPHSAYSTESQPQPISLWSNIGPELWLLNSGTSGISRD